MQLRLACFLLIFAFAGGAPAGQESPPTPAPVDPILLRPNVWESTPQELEPELKKLQFEWISANQDTARSALPGLAFQKHSLNEAILSFRDGKLAEARLFYFNRGDSGSLREDQFEGLLAGITADLSALAGRQPVDRGRDPGSAVKAEGRIWETGHARYLLEWSATKGSQLRAIPFRAEFIRLAIRPSVSAPAPIGVAPMKSRDVVKGFVGRDHVERVAGGDVKLRDVPMVDQGEKGYCVVASVERVLRYYGASVDQHELAQIANSDAAGGTSVDAMLASLKRLTTRLGVKARSLYEWNIRDFLKMLETYNRATKRGKLAPEVAFSGQIINMDSCFGQMKPEILKEVRMKSSADFGRFKRDIQRSIDEGIPLLWSVRLGLVKEEAIPQASGGHMRIIIGYNTATDEILYSDSWGMGHEEKRMRSDDAWTITNSLSSLQPVS
ncbi:MAG TPA: C39 family peptidase [Terrimicrobiaceae bacterium]